MGKRKKNKTLKVGRRRGGVIGGMRGGATRALVPGYCFRLLFVTSFQASHKAESKHPSYEEVLSLAHNRRRTLKGFTPFLTRDFNP